jgi:hypothetical protein
MGTMQYNPYPFFEGNMDFMLFRLTGDWPPTDIIFRGSGMAEYDSRWCGVVSSFRQHGTLTEGWNMGKRYTIKQYNVEHWGHIFTDAYVEMRIES